jgi:hypothetical protein
MKKELESTACHEFFAVMDMEGEEDSDFELLPSLVTYS